MWPRFVLRKADQWRVETDEWWGKVSGWLTRITISPTITPSRDESWSRQESGPANQGLAVSSGAILKTSSNKKGRSNN